jgi:TRAP-type C4-dicarboxylate transport system permease small subunit
VTEQAVENPSRPHAPVRAVIALSAALLSVERVVIAGLMFLLAALVLLNVTTRYLGRPIYWVDESAVYSVVWLTFVGASAMTRLRLDFAVGLLTEKLGPRSARIARVIATLGVVSFGLLLAWMCWLWLDPVGVASAGFDAREFAAQTFNFVYTERTQTLNWPTWILYLCIPLFAVTLTVHGVANLLEDLGLAQRTTFPGFTLSTADAVN